MKTVAIIQARMGSTRLPGKVMKVLIDKTVLGQLITRVQRCPLVDEIVIATTRDKQDDVITEEAAKFGASFFRGSEQDVLERYHGAATESKAETVIRITSDCPLYDETVLTAMLRQYGAWKKEGKKVDYFSNSLKRTFPRGLDTEIFPFHSLERAFREATKSYEREHVTPYLYQHPELFALLNFENDVDLSALRWTLDTGEDWRLIQEIYRRLSPQKPAFTTADVLWLLDKSPELSKINAHISQKSM